MYVPSVVFRESFLIDIFSLCQMRVWIILPLVLLSILSDVASTKTPDLSEKISDNRNDEISEEQSSGSHSKTKTDTSEHDNMKKKKKTGKETPSNDSIEEFYDACDGTSQEACHCEDEEINCEDVVFDDMLPLNTSDLDINDKNFRVIKANFKRNAITRIQKGKILRGHEETIQELDFSENMIISIERGSFLALRSLAKLYLSKNKIRTIKKEWFEGLENLHQLYLDHNKITSLENGVFKELTNLKKLILDGNKITFRKELFTGLDSLEELSLDFCNIIDLDVKVFDYLPNLKKLSLIGNPFTDVPRAVNSLQKLEYLDLSQTNINEFHSQSLKEDHGLVQLFMKDMPFLYAIQDCAFCGLQKIEMINMNNSSRLYELHPNAFGWQKPESDRVYSLKYLHIENCNISLITEDLLDWDLLTELRIGGNPINCSCETAFLMEGEIYSYEYSNSLPKCYYPEKLRGRPLVKVQQVEACSGIQTAQRSTRFARVLMILLVLVFISVTMYYMIISGRLKALCQKVQYPQVSYSNLANKDDQQSLEHDFQPRPQDV